MAVRNLCGSSAPALVAVASLVSIPAEPWLSPMPSALVDSGARMVSLRCGRSVPHLCAGFPAKR